MSNQGAGRSTNMHKASAVHRAYYGDDNRRAAKIKERERQRFAPRFNQLAYGKKYILPQYRYADYFSQEAANKLYCSNVLRPVEVMDFDDVANAAFVNAIQAMKCGRPQLWLERELGEAFMRTELPTDMTAADVKWRWPGFRVHLPREILSITAGSSTRSLMYMDICLIPPNTGLKIPEPYASELEALVAELGWPFPKAVHEIQTHRYDRPGLMIAGNLNGPYEGWEETGDISRQDYMIYAVVKPFDSVTLGQIRRVTNTDGSLQSPYESTEDDNRFCEKILHLGLNILLYLGSAPTEYQPEEVIRKPSLEGKHSIPGLYRARFVGASQLRPSSQAHTAHMITGRHLPQHWRAGHWKRICYGPKNELRKLAWIQPYSTHGPADLVDTAEKKS